MEDLNAYFSQIKNFQLLQFAEKTDLFLRYPQTWLVDWDVSPGNLERQVIISKIRLEVYNDALKVCGVLPYFVLLWHPPVVVSFLLQEQLFSLSTKYVNIIWTTPKGKKKTMPYIHKWLPYSTLSPDYLSKISLFIYSYFLWKAKRAGSLPKCMQKPELRPWSQSPVQASPQCQEHKYLSHQQPSASHHVH